MESINIREASLHLSRLLDDVAGGLESVIEKGGKPMARLVPLEPRATGIRFGVLKGKITIAADFDAPVTLADLLDR